MTDCVLLIVDDRDFLRLAGDVLERSGYAVLREETSDGALVTYERELPDVVVQDMSLPGHSGLALLQQLTTQGAAVILLAGDGDVPTATNALQFGAERFLTKPVHMPQLVAAIQQAGEKVRLRREVQLLRSGVGAKQIEGTLGVSRRMRDLERQIALVAEDERTTALLTGERGTGKGRVARAVHTASPRANAPFVAVRCGCGPPAVLDDELFGHERGALAHAARSKEGLIEIASGGTLFLDEVGDLALALQPKLLRLLEERQFRRVGGTRAIGTDVRLLAATHRDLVRAVADGAFRDDLYARLSVTTLRLPPVRDRNRDDRVHLVRRILNELAEEMPDAPTDMTDDALDGILCYRWPGNVREMRNALEHAMIMARDASVIAPRHLPAVMRPGGNGPRRSPARSLKELERRHIARALRRHDGNRTLTAKELGISRVTLLKKIREYGIEA